ncbi:MAG: thioredoxin family protein [candidate division Zixibacteria bacterium]|nr:thioredoxin family protein [candidate division Zixibacteria bacterium]
MKLKVLGPGCARCRELFERTQKAVSELGIECELEKVEDINQITSYGVLFTPALVIDEQLKFSGKLPSVEELKSLIQEKVKE